MKNFKRCLALVLAFAMILELWMIPMNRVEAANGSKYMIKVNRKQCCVTIYEKDDAGEYTIPVRAMACSVGVNNLTPKGTFRLQGHYRWHLMFFNVYAQYCSRITNHVLFHSVCYNDQDPARLRYRDYNKLGSPASHGCIRLSTGDAKWIFDHCGAGTVVKIYDGENPGPLGKPDPVRINLNSPNRNWDPTDPSKANPWRKVAPIIKISKNAVVERGASLNDLKKIVTATNYLNKKVKVTVSGEYNLNKVGTYSICFKAKDNLGNVTRLTAKIKVRDTKKPTIFFEKKKVILKDEDFKILSKKNLEKKLLENIILVDNKVQLDKKYIHLESEKLFKAMENNAYGEYKIKVSATDKSGNCAKERVLTVVYQEPKKKIED